MVRRRSFLVDDFLLLERGGHVVEGGGQSADLVIAVDGYTAAQVTQLDALCARRRPSHGHTHGSRDRHDDRQPAAQDVGLHTDVSHG